MKLQGRIAVVTGASRGVGKGIAVGLGEAGATVYVTGRTLEGNAHPLGGSIQETAEAVTRAGGRGIAVRCDHAVDEDVEALFAQVKAEQGRLDILVNNAFAVPAGKVYGVPFWELPLSVWDDIHRVGLRSHYVASVFAAPLLLAAGAGQSSPRLVANVSSFGARVYALNVAYGVGKAGVDRLTSDMAHDFKPHGVASVSLWPGVVKTERVLRGEFPYNTEGAESPVFTGRAVAALATDPKLMEKTGKPLVVAELAMEYGFTDIDGSQPKSLREKKR